MRQQPFKKSLAGVAAIASFLPHSAMANNALEYPPASDFASASMLAMTSEAPTLAIKRIRSTDSDDGRRKRPRHESQTINTQGTSGNARVVNIGGDHMDIGGDYLNIGGDNMNIGGDNLNIGGDYIMHNNDGLGVEAQAVLESIEQRLKVVHDKELDKEVGGWLAAPDVSQNLNAAIRKRQPGTGDWFLDGKEFAEWKENSQLLLCIYGAPGCGKTVLCSTIIEAVKDLCKTPLSGWAYFFFDYRNAHEGLQLYENFLRSVLSQLSSRCGGTPETVETMYKTHGSGKERPSVKALEETLRQVIEAFDDVYIMLDALDESGDRDELLKWIETLASWSSTRWHLLTTSRSEPDIKSRLEHIPNIRIVRLQGKTLDKDISTFLNKELSFIIRWSEPIRALIKTTLVDGADGMFRWVAMQIDSLKTCMNVREVKEKLKALPKGLEETYERILTTSTRRHDLLSMLRWLAFSARALKLEEIAEVSSVDFDAVDGPCYEPDLKYANPQIALTVCAGLITETDGFVKLAHFSVKEYLISDRIRTGPAAHFALNLHLSHSVIAQTCAAYLLIFNQSDSLEHPGGTSGRFPLHLYAAQNSPDHLRLMENKACPILHELLLKLFIATPPYESALNNWVLTYNFDKYHRNDKKAPPIYYASFLGLRDVVECLIKNNHNVNCKGGWYGSALAAAAANAHTETAKLLLEHGADVNIQGGQYESALQVAATEGSTEIVKMLLEHDSADNIQGMQYGNTVRAAVSAGHTDIVKMLLDHGADVNIQRGQYGTALQAVVSEGHTDVVKMLLEHGADINIQGGEYGTALQAAVSEGYTDIVKILLEHGANINIQGGKYGTALRAGVSVGYTDIVKMLIDHGADINIQAGEYGTALQAAAFEGHIEVVKLLLAHGADNNIQGGQYEIALRRAAARNSLGSRI